MPGRRAEDERLAALSARTLEDYKEFRETVVQMVLGTDMRAHFEHRKGLKCGPGTACFGGENGVGKWGDLVCVNVARYGLEAAIDRLLCALHCSQACGVAGVRDKIVAYVRDEERKAREDYWASWSA